MRDMRAFAREWLEELVRVDYYGVEESLDLPFKHPFLRTSPFRPSANLHP